MSGRPDPRRRTWLYEEGAPAASEATGAARAAVDAAKAAGEPTVVVNDYDGAYPRDGQTAAEEVAEQRAKAAGTVVDMPGAFDSAFEDERTRRAAYAMAHGKMGFDEAWHRSTQGVQVSTGQGVTQTVEPATTDQRAAVERMRRQIMDEAGLPGGATPPPSGGSASRPRPSDEPAEKGPVWTVVDRLDQELKDLKMEELLRKVGVITGIAAGSGATGALFIDELNDPYD